MSNKTTPPLWDTPAQEGNVSTGKENSPPVEGWQAQPDGVVPRLRFPEFRDDWLPQKLGELGRFIGGGTPDKSISDYWQGDIPWISSSDIYEDNIHTIAITRFINKKSIAGSATKIVPKGSVLFVSRVGTGKLAVNNKDVCTSQDFTNFIPIEIYNYFLGYFFAANKSSLVSLGQGTSIKGFTKSDLENFDLNLPSESEQQKIAACLSSIDELITFEAQKLDTLKTHKKGLMQQLFPTEGETLPKLRFPKFREVGEWEEKTLEKIATYENGKAHENNIIENGQYIVVNSKFISTEGSTRKYSDDAFCIADAGDVLMVLSDVPNGRAIAKCYSVEADNLYTVNQRICKIKPNEIDGKFLFYILDRNPFFLAFDDGVKQTNLRKEDVLSCPLYLPSLPEEQNKISQLVSSIDELITTQTQKLDTLKVHKKGLMQQLFPVLDEVPA